MHKIQLKLVHNGMHASPTNIDFLKSMDPSLLMYLTINN